MYYNSYASSLVCLVCLVCDAQVFTWGYNAQGEIGNGSTNNIYAPYHVALGKS